jgi:hypothetical protein
MKIRNKVHRYEDREYLKFLAEELDFMGRHYRLDLKAGTLTVFALPPKRVKKKREDKEKEPRNKRAESAARHG